MANSCKYYKQKKQFSTNSGQTWQDVTPFEYRSGSFIEADSPDCREGTLISRWVTVPDAFLCDGKAKYEKQVGQYSLDNGATWQYYYPSIYQFGNLIEANAQLCNNKWEGYYLGSIISSYCPVGYIYVEGRGCVRLDGVDPVKYVRCSSTTSTTLTSGDTVYRPYSLYTGIIGDCVTAIGDNAFDSCTGLTSVTIPNSVTSIGNGAFRYCSGLTSVTIPDSVTSIGTSVFNQCSRLSSVTIGNRVNSIGESGFYACYRLRNITIPDSVTSIGASAFRYCTGLTSVTMGSGLTSIGVAAFENCRSLTSVTIPDSVTSIGTSAFTKCINMTSAVINSGSIGASAFTDCSGLTSVTMGSGVTSVGNAAFYNLTGMTNAIINGSIGASAFTYCRSLTSVTIGNNTTNIGEWSFFRCTGLTSVSIGSGVTRIGRDAFRSCESLTSVTINATTPPVLEESSWGVFYNTNNCPIYVPCESVDAYKSSRYWSEYVNRIRGIPPCVSYRWAESGTTCIGYDKYQNNIKQVSYDYVNWENVVPNEFSASTLIEAYSQDCGAPYNYKWLATYSDSHTESASCDTSSTITQNDINITNLTNVDINGCVTSITINSFSGASSLSSVTIADSVSGIGYNAFRGCVSLTQINLPTGLTYIADSLFYNCTALTQINLPTGLTIIYGSAFRNCQSLTSITIPDSVTEIRQDAFNSCTGLTSVTIGSGVTKTGAWIFSGCTSLTSIRVLATTPPSLGTYAFDNTNNCPIYVPCESVSAFKTATTWRNYASRIVGDCPFSGKWLATYSDSHTESASCDSSSAITNNEITKSGLTSVEIGDCVTTIGNDAFYNCSGLASIEIPDSVTSIGEYAFLSCIGLTSVTIPNSVTTIGNDAFQECRSLTSIVIPSGVTSIGDGTFRACTSLSSVLIPDSITNIGYRAFYYCTGLTSVDIPSGVTNIGTGAFESCRSLTSITINATTPPTLGDTTVFSDTNNCPIYVPAQYVSAYQNAWSSYASRIQPIT